MLQNYIFRQKETKSILLMTHLVIGYPSLNECYTLVSEMSKTGVDIIELQIPTLSANLDGATIKNANATAMTNGVSVKDCFTFASKLTSNIISPLVFVAYYDTVKEYGFYKFFNEVYNVKVASIIIPDIPNKQQFHLHRLAASAGITITPVIFPKSSSIHYIPLLEYSEFCYCATHNGSTGSAIKFDDTLLTYIKAVKKNILQPIAVGFGIKNRNHINFLKGYADIAVIGTKIMKIVEKNGIRDAVNYLRKLSK